MATITAKQVNDLRTMTGAGMMDCKKALEETGGNVEAAIDWLRKKGQKLSVKRADKETSEGSVFVRTFNNDTEGVVVALLCETDFVAKNDDFQNLGSKLVELAMSLKPTNVEELKNAVLEGRTAQDFVTDLVGKIGERIELAYSYLKGDKVVSYTHLGAKVGVLVAVTGNGEEAMLVGKDVCMQIAATKPLALSPEDVDTTIVEKEKTIAIEKAIADGKPANIVEKIAMGTVNKFLKENTLLSQSFVKDEQKTIQQYLDSKSLKVTAFSRIGVGNK